MIKKNFTFKSSTVLLRKFHDPPLPELLILLILKFWTYIYIITFKYIAIYIQILNVSNLESSSSSSRSSFWLWCILFNKLEWVVVSIILNTTNQKILNSQIFRVLKVINNRISYIHILIISNLELCCCILFNKFEAIVISMSVDISNQKILNSQILLSFVKVLETKIRVEFWISLILSST